MVNESRRVDYFLFFATQNIKGLERMKEAMWRVDPLGDFCFSDATDPNGLTLFGLEPALQDATLFAPWSLFGLDPPSAAFYSMALPAILLDFPRYAPAAIMGAALTQLLYSSRAQSDNDMAAATAFAQRLGFFVNDYVSAAVKNPEGFDEYRQRRRQEMGISPRSIIFRPGLG